MYTREEVLAMPAGRELDALAINTFFSTPYVADELGLWVSVKFGEEPSLFKPSENVRDAWTIVEKIDGEVTIKKYEMISGNYQYWCRVSYGYEEFLGTAATAPLAICRAALLSLLKEDAHE